MSSRTSTQESDSSGVRRSTSPESLLSTKPSTKWYCMKAICRELNFSPSTKCSVCGSPKEPTNWTPLPSSNSQGSKIVQPPITSQIRSVHGEIGIRHNNSAQVSVPSVGGSRGRGRGRGRLINQHDIGLHGKPKMRRSLPFILNTINKVTISWVDSLSEFYIVKVDDVAELDKIENGTYNAWEWPNLEEPAVDDSCLCIDKDSTYSSWYRARILSIGKTSLQVQFVDFENKNMEYKDELKTLPEQWINYPEFAKKASLKMPDSFESTESIVQLFKKLTNHVPCSFMPLEYDIDNDSYIGSLLVDKVGDIGQALLQASGTGVPQTFSLGTPTESESQSSSGNSDVSSVSFEYPFTLNKLNQSVLRPGNRQTFVITSWLEFDHFYIRDMERETKRKLFELSDLMNEYMTDKKKQKRNSSVNPVVGEIYVVAQASAEGVKYFRGVVENITVEHYCKVRNVDDGRQVFAAIKDITRMTREIFQIPVLAYEVRLSGFENSPNLIFKNDFEKMMRSIQREKEVLKVDVVEVVDTCAIVYLKFGNGSLLSSRILKLRKWLWEDMFDLGARTDEEIVQKEAAHGYDSETTIIDLDVPLLVDIEAIVRAVVPEKDGKLPNVVLEPITKYTSDLKEAFRNQVNNYMRKVNASKFFPRFGEMAFVLPPDGFSGAGEWQRCLRAKVGEIDTLYCIDTYVPYPTVTEGGFTYRRVVSDFMRIPALVATGRLHDPTFDLFTSNCMLKTFIAGEKVTIRLLEKIGVNLFAFESCDMKETMSKELYNKIEAIDLNSTVEVETNELNDLEICSWD